MKKLFAILGCAFLADGGVGSAQENSGSSFGTDLEFLKKHVEVVVLTGESGEAQVAVVPAYQGRVMTSTAGGAAGLSYGWVNRELIASGKTQEHINVFGGEDRFWLGPEGGQFSIFFAKGVAFDMQHWFTPAAIDTESFAVTDKSASYVTCTKKIQLANYSGTQFDLQVTREVRLLDPKKAGEYLGLEIKPAVKSVAYESVNSVKNTGAAAWKKETGLLSIWILGMFNASPRATVVVPYQSGPESALGPVVNDSYFGKVPADRLVVKEKALFFAADSHYRSKIGLSPKRCKPVLGSYDADNKVLTLVQFTRPEGVTDYVNSMWKIQDDPFAGDVVNSYNDGPSALGGKQMGQFYELETSSPALALQPDQSATHSHRTIHLQGPEADLDAISQAVLGVSLDEIKNGLKK